MSAVHILIPETFIQALRAHVTGFKVESDRNQWGFARMAWEGAQKRRQHLAESGAVSFTVAELHALFGREEFDSVRRRVNFFTRSPGWSHKKGITKAYWFSGEVQAAIAAYAVETLAAPVNLLRLSGSRMIVATSLPRAISSTGTSGTKVSTAAWERAKGLNKLPVNTEALDALRQCLEAHLRGTEIDEGELRQYVARYRDITVKIIGMSNTTLAGAGFIPQVYSIAPSGRLYARGVNESPRLSWRPINLSQAATVVA